VTDATRAEVERLERKSLVATPDDRGRYRLLDTIRAYATEQLDASGEADLVRKRHASWFTDLARSLEPPTWIDSSADGHAAFDADLPNFRVALQHALDDADGGRAVSIVRSLAPYLYPKVSRREGREMTGAALSLSGADPVDRGHVLYLDAAFAMDLGLAEETRAALTEAEALFQRAGDPHGLSMVENLRCFHEAALGHYDESLVAGERACAYAREAGSEALAELTKGHLAVALLGLGAGMPVRDESALLRCLELGRSAVRRAESSGNPYELLLSHGNIVSPLLELGELEEALTHLRRAAELQQVHDFAFPYVVIDGADAASRLGEHETAVRLLSCGLAELERSDVRLQAYTSRRADAIRADARTALETGAFQAHERAGKAMSVADALQLVLTIEPARRAPVSSR
jgi:tetratricopeptide (TPR) repeat protein